MGNVKDFLALVRFLGLLPLCCAQIGDFCQTPRREQGECLVISSCSPLFSILKNRPIRPQDADYLRRSQCGFEGSLPKVCCPLGGSSQDAGSSSSNEKRPVSSNLLPNSICGFDSQDRIYGGKEADLNEFPWMALVEYERETGKRGFYCGGVLINNRYVLTAAHCIKGKDLPRSWKLVSVRLGEHNTDTDIDCADDKGEICSPPPLNIPVEEQIAHEDYVPEDINQYHDIGLLRLAREVKFSTSVAPICLPTSLAAQKAELTGKKLTVAGWGKTETRSESPVKLKLNVPVKPNSDCVRTYRKANVNLNNNGQLCAGGERGKDSCRGDSGGPLMNFGQNEEGQLVWYSVGVVSFGPSPCGLEEWPGVYTKVSNYVQWIVNKLRP